MTGLVLGTAWCLVGVMGAGCERWWCLVRVMGAGCEGWWWVVGVLMGAQCKMSMMTCNEC